jgi:hypothetical protein
VSIEEARKLFAGVKDLEATLAPLGIDGIEISASGKPPRYLVFGFARDLEHWKQIESALAAYENVESDVVLAASKKSGRAPSALDGDPNASPGRKAVRARLDIGAVCRERNDYDQAIRMSLQAANLAREAKDPALEALSLYAEAAYLVEGAGIHRQKTNPAEVLARAVNALKAVPGLDPILERNIAQLERTLAARSKP